MSFIERLLEGVQVKREEAQQRQALEIAAEEARRNDEEILTKGMEREQQVMQARERQRLEGVLGKFSVKERLEAIRDGVWKVGEIEPIIERPYTRYNAAGKPQLILPAEPPILQGYCLRYSYPVIIPIWKWDKAVVMETYSAVNGRGSYSIPQIVVTGYCEAENFDAVYITADQSRDEVNLSAISRCEPEYPWKKHSGIRNLKDGVGSMHFLPNDYYPQTSPVDGFHISTPDVLGKVIIDYCYEMIRNNRLPLQSEGEMQRSLVAARRDGRIR